MDKNYTIKVHSDKDLEWELKSLIRSCDELLDKQNNGRLTKKELKAHRNSISFCLYNHANTVIKERNLFLDALVEIRDVLRQYGVDKIVRCSVGASHPKEKKK